MASGVRDGFRSARERLKVRASQATRRVFHSHSVQLASCSPTAGSSIFHIVIVAPCRDETIIKKKTYIGAEQV